jgi:hypothetical protein
MVFLGYGRAACFASDAVISRLSANIIYHFYGALIFIIYERYMAFF